MLLRIVVVRHAKPYSEGYADETLRSLSPEGVFLQEKMTLHLKALGIIPDIIFSSPIVRAQETAYLIRQIFGDVEVVTLDALGYDFDEEEILSHLPDPSENQTVYLVGHAPTLEGFASRLVGESILPRGLPTSGALIVDFREPPAFGMGEYAGYYAPHLL